MNVTLINYTHQALETLIYTKNTRLNMTPDGFEAICAWPAEKKLAELEYMRYTIQSQMEFCDYMFCITGVTRAFTHQLVRHRVGTSFAQQAQRAVDMTGFDFVTGPSIQTDAQRNGYNSTMEEISNSYNALIHLGVRPQDARGVLPTNICTNINIKINLRALSEMLSKRLCVKAQGEFQDVARLMRQRVLEVHPWAEPFLRVHCAKTGVCLFHTFPVADCPAKRYVYNPDTGEAYGGGRPGTLDLIQLTWDTNRAEAQPVVVK